MKKFIIQAVALLILTFGTLAYYSGNLEQFSLSPSQSKLTEVIIKNTRLKVEIADTIEKRKRGLGGKERLDEGTGMLFLFPKPDYYNFWIKDMKFPIDIIWLKDSLVIDITRNAYPPAEQKDSDLPVYTPTLAADSVLEVNAGFSDSNGIMIGDTLEVFK